MELTAASFKALQRAVITAWQEGANWRPPVDLSFLFRDFAGTGAFNLYAWQNMTPKFREWFGDRVFSDLDAYLFEVYHRHFEKSEKCKATIIEDDVPGVLVNQIAIHASAWQQLLHDIVIEVLTGNPVAFTGKAFFANDHAYGANTIDNLVTDALSETSFEAAFTAAAAWKGANDVTLNPRFTHLVHGPKLHGTAFHIVDAEFHASGGVQVNNPNYRRCQRVELPELSGDYDDYWGLFDCSGVVKPVARQIRKQAVHGTNDFADVLETGVIKWMSDGRAAAAPTFPHLGYMGRL